MTIRRQPNGQYAVDSETSDKSYVVSETSCSCPHHQYRGVECKHMTALKAHLTEQTALGRAAEKAAHLTEPELQRALTLHRGDAAQCACLLELAVRKAHAAPKPIPAGVEAFLVGASPEERERALAVYR